MRRLDRIAGLQVRRNVAAGILLLRGARFLWAIFCLDHIGDEPLLPLYWLNVVGRRRCLAGRQPDSLLGLDLTHTQYAVRNT